LKQVETNIAFTEKAGQMLPHGSGLRLMNGMDERARELRQRAALCRRAAAVPSSGDAIINRELIALAQRLEQQAAVLERISRRRTG
jgi:hypothetical protein